MTKTQLLETISREVVDVLHDENGLIYIYGRKSDTVSMICNSISRNFNVTAIKTIMLVTSFHSCDKYGCLSFVHKALISFKNDDMMCEIKIFDCRVEDYSIIE